MSLRQLRTSFSKYKVCSNNSFYAWLVVALLVASPSAAKDLGAVGKTYAIAERSAIEEMKERAAKVDWKKLLSKVKPENYRPANRVSLPRASKPVTRLVDLTYSLEMDIPDGKGGILYPKGYTFNPLDYISYPKTLVLVNAEDPAQLKWFKASEFAKRIDVMLLITDGPFADVIKSLQRPVFYADSRIASKFDIQALPSTVRQSGRFMEVREYVVKGR